MNIELLTFKKNINGTFSDVMSGGRFLGVSVERPWNDNKRFVSCVPAGEYKLIPYNSTSYGFVYLLSNPELGVYPFEEQCKSNKDRYGCIFVHKGSYPHNFQGCIGIGDEYIESMNMVKNTKNTCKSVISLLQSKDEQHTLTINRGDK